MADVKFMEGFEDDGFDVQATAWSSGTLETTDIPYTGASAFNVPLDTQQNLPSNSATWTGESGHIFLRMRVDYENDGTTKYILWRRWVAAGGNQGEYIDIRWDPNGGWFVCVYNNSCTAFTTSPPDDEWFTLEWSWDFTADTTARMRVWLNGSIVFTSDDIGSQNWESDKGHYLNFDSNVPATKCRIDDLIYAEEWTTTPWNNAKVVRLLPDANGANTDWTGSYTDIDDANPSTSTGTSITSSTVTDVSTFSHEAMPSAAGAVIAVAYDVHAAGSGNLDVVFRSGGTDYNEVDAIALPGAADNRRHIMGNSPATASAWTKSEIDNGEFGVELS